jgi:hypothetical protein
MKTLLVVISVLVCITFGATTVPIIGTVTVPDTVKFAAKSDTANYAKSTTFVFATYKLVNNPGVIVVIDSVAQTWTTSLDTAVLHALYASWTSLPQTAQISVGDWLYTDNPANPATYKGYGTWVELTGKLLFGFDGADTSFNSVGKFGGSKTFQTPPVSAGTPTGTVSAIAASLSPTAKGVSDTSQVASAKHTHPAPTFIGNLMPTHFHAAASDLPPYRVTHIWQRVS